MASTSKKAADRVAKAAAARAEQKRKEQRRRIINIGGVVLAMVLVIGVILTITLVQQDKKDKRLADAAAASSEFGLTIGPDDAPHKVVIYEDFLCPFCGELEKETRVDLEELAGKKKVQVEYRPYDLLSQAFGDYSIRAAGAFSIVMEKSGPEIAKKFHDLLFENQPAEKGTHLSDEQLIDLAVKAGAEEADVKQPILDGDGKDWVEKATAEAKRAGVEGTPTILLDGENYQDGRTIQELATNLIAALK